MQCTASAATMTKMMRRLALVTLAALPLLAGFSFAKEGETVVFPALQTEQRRLEIHAATDLEAIRPLIRDFQSMAPDVAVTYVEYVTNDLQRRAETACRHGTAWSDLVLSSALDQLVKLANDGCARPHHVPESALTRPWANWRDEVFGFTYEPATIVYNTRFVPPDEVPRTHTQLADLLRRQLGYYRGRVGTFDIRLSGVGYQLAFEDARQPGAIYGQLIESMSRAEAVVHCCTSVTLAEIASGRLYIGYNMLGSYAFAAAKRNADLRVVVPRDYALVLSRGVLIPKTARNPDLAARFLDYLLSERGQAVVRKEAFFFEENARLPDAVEGATDLEKSGIARPIRIGPALLAMQDKAQRRRFIDEWSRSMAGAAGDKVE